ncbi:uncharacterized protein si:dkey-56m19.5 [Pristis pectinata]|uniref:uncharacterized protein si:dkey-56m19.5 n=1 Tax=Pristis pectinata TaxID=685728 RepID=UPI00223C8CBD|nr:uncharacterized protein si:dkey-56m19.5 [Pristis pectinata]
MSRPGAQSLPRRLGDRTSSLCCCRRDPEQEVNSMGGRLGRKRRGYNVSEPKENRTAAESTENPEVKQIEPENKVSSKDQFKTIGEQQPASEAPKQADERPGERETALVTVDVETAEINNVAVVSTSTELPHGSQMQENVISAGLVEAAKQLPDQAEQCPLPEAGVQSSAIPEIGSAAEVPDVAVPSEPQTKEVPENGSNGETLKSDLDTGKSVPEIPEDPSPEKSSLGDQTVTNLDEQLEVYPCGNLNVQVDPGKILEGVSGETLHAAMSLPVSHEAPLQPTLKEIETSVQETRSESPVKCDFSKEDEEPKLAAIIEETPIDVVLKNEVALCADLEKDVTEPDTKDEAQGVVGEPLHSTTQVTPDSGEPSDCVQDNSACGSSNAAETEDHSQSLEGSGNASVDSCSVTDTVQVDLVAAESVPENTCPSIEKLTETSHEQTVELIGCQDSIEEISLLKTNSELIPDIKLTVYGEGLQEEEEKDDTQPAPVDETIALDTNTDPQPPNEVLDENQSTLRSAEVGLEMHKSSDQEIVKLETSGDPAPECGSSGPIEEVLAKVNTEETSSTENSTAFVDAGKPTESITSKTEDDNHPESSVTNGTTPDGELRNQSKVEVIGQITTAEVEEDLQASSSEPIISNTTEQVIENLPAEESCLALDNQTLNSGPLDVNVE